MFQFAVCVQRVVGDGVGVGHCWHVLRFQVVFALRVVQQVLLQLQLLSPVPLSQLLLQLLLSQQPLAEAWFRLQCVQAELMPRFHFALDRH